MKQNFANLGTRTPDRRQIFAHLYHWARKLLLILLGDTDLPANRESTYNPPLSRGFFFSDSLNRGGRFCTQVVRSGAVLHWGGVFARGISALSGDRTRDGAASGVLPLPLG